MYALILILLAGTSWSLHAAENCSQPRFTGLAPASIYHSTSPIAPTAENVAAGQALYEGGVHPPCYLCHGMTGDGRGPISLQFDPPPRDFTCARTVIGIPDGQLFWIVQNGAPGTDMPAFNHLEERQIWQIVQYLRALAR